MYQIVYCYLQAPDELQAALKDWKVAEEQGYCLQVRSIGRELAEAAGSGKLLGAAQPLW